MYYMKKIILGLAVIVFFIAPYAYASDNLEVAGWVPYWRDSEGMKDAIKHLSQIDAVYPFVFTVKLDGTLYDNAGLGKKDWKSFIKAAQKKNVEIIPTVMWNDGASTHRILSNPTLRKAHVSEIVAMVTKGKYDGVGIDYEGKNAETINFFSQFLKELKEALGTKILTCTIEARTPPDSLYKEVPATITYANDYKEIAKYCDRIEIMAYDQQRADIKLNSERRGVPYMPVSDTDWVKKVAKLAVETLPKEKIILGMATYGNHWEVTVAPDWFKDYRRIGALNVPDILDLAKEYKIKPVRSTGGEMTFAYVPKTASKEVKKALKVAKNAKGSAVWEKALEYANKTGKTVTINLAVYSDALAMKDKIDLAKEYNFRGVALFKIDGEEDQKVWNYLK